MSGRSPNLVKGAALVVAVFLLLSPTVFGGDKQREPPSSPVRSSPAPSPVAYWGPSAVTVSISVTPATRSALEPYYVNIRGPDGQVRRFPVEGGPAAIQAPPVIVLRPGQSVNIRWVAGR